MKRGLVIGKFLPLHEGHIALVRFAAERCDELILSMSYKPDDPIDPHLRFGWIGETFRDLPSVHPEMVIDDFDDESLPMPERTAIWAAFIRKRYPPVNVLFSSEAYGEPFSFHLGVPHVPFDIERRRVPVSAAQIRQRPFAHWDYIPSVVRPYYVKKICFYGPESTGKSVLARHLADVYHTTYVPEVAKEIITSNAFTLEDTIRIGYGQTERVLESAKVANKILLCDTDVITTTIYSAKYLHHIPDILNVLERKVQYDVYLLFDVDVPWIADGIRDLKDERPAMYAWFRDELVKRGISFVRVHGNYDQREQIVRHEIEMLLKK